MAFSEYKASKPTRSRKGLCPVCGKPTAGRVQINLGEREAGAYNVIDSTSLTLCEKHATEAYEQLKRLFRKITGTGGGELMDQRLSF